MKSPRLTEDDLRTFQGNREHGRVRGGVDRKRLVIDVPGNNSRPAADNSRHELENGPAVYAEPVSSPAPAPSPFKSKWEATYSAKLELEKQAGIIKAYWYEPFSLWLPGKVRYKPDFLIQYPAGLERSLEIIEVKGWSKNRRDGMTRLKIAAALFPCFAWRLVCRTKGGGWDGEYL